MEYYSFGEEVRFKSRSATLFTVVFHSYQRDVFNDLHTFFFFPMLAVLNIDELSDFIFT